MLSTKSKLATGRHQTKGVSGKHISQSPGSVLVEAPLRECAKLAWLMKLYTTILYSTGVKIVVNTTVGKLGAV